jgi:hypothetical protein
MPGDDLVTGAHYRSTRAPSGKICGMRRMLLASSDAPK